MHSTTIGNYQELPGALLQYKLLEQVHVFQPGKPSCNIELVQHKNLIQQIQAID